MSRDWRSKLAFNYVLSVSLHNTVWISISRTLNFWTSRKLKPKVVSLSSVGLSNFIPDFSNYSICQSNLRFLGAGSIHQDSTVQSKGPEEAWTRGWMLHAPVIGPLIFKTHFVGEGSVITWLDCNSCSVSSSFNSSLMTSPGFLDSQDRFGETSVPDLL